MGPAPFDWSRHGRVLGVAAGTKAMQEFGRNAPKKVHRITDVTKASCCFDRSQCVKHRSHWKQGGHSSVELFQIADPTSGREETVRDSFALVAGEGNFPRHTTRGCAALLRDGSERGTRWRGYSGGSWGVETSPAPMVPTRTIKLVGFFALARAQAAHLLARCVNFGRFTVPGETYA
jgi:hypothetical protein